MRWWWPSRCLNASRRSRHADPIRWRTVEVTRDYGETANEKANELLFHLGLATVSIIVLVCAAIGWREAIVVAVVIPVTILLTLFASNT
jgi:multidrug efflux pump subunit AcrB